MLTLRFGVLRQPAVSHRRLLLSVLLSLATVPTGACSRREPADVAGFRAALGRAIRMVRRDSPEKARQLERLLGDAEVATAAEAATPWWEGSVGRSEAAWARAMRAALEATRHVRAVRGTLEERTGALLDAVRDDVARARAEIREAGMGRREGAAMERATNRLATAERLVLVGAHAAAAAELEAAREDCAIVHAGWAALHARFADPVLRQQWRRMVAETIEASRLKGEVAIVVDKLRRRVTIYDGGREVGRFRAELGANGLRRKEHAGDRATPEGRYRVVERKEGHRTRYYKALLIDYPNDDDRMRFALGKTRGSIPYRAGIGGLIEIHGGGGEGLDWTDGCVALANGDMDRVYALAKVGTPVTIVGTHER